MRLRGLIACFSIVIGASCVLDRDGRDTIETSGSGAEGGGTVLCSTVADCPDEECRIADCVEGECRATPEETGTACGDGRTCDVASVCKIPDGEACAEGADCHSGACADGVCCDEECNGVCASCLIDAGVCTVIEAGNDPEDDCPDDAVCGGGLACASGDHVWSMAFASTEDTAPQAVAVDDSGNVIFAFEFSGSITLGNNTHTTSVTETNAVLVKTDEDGNWIWSYQLAGSFDEIVNGIVTDADGGIYVAGDFSGSINILGTPLNTTGTGFDGFLFKLDADGALVWTQHFSGLGTNRATDVALAPDDAIVVVGSFDGPHLVNGVTHTPTATNDSEVWAAKFMADGAHQWTRVFPHAGNDYGLGVAVAESGAVLVAGEFNGTFETFTSNGVDVFVATLDENGTTQNTQAWIAMDTQRMSAITTTPDDGFAIAGTFDGFADFGGGQLPNGGNSDAFIAVFDDAGAHVWSESYGTSGQQVIEEIAADSIGNFVIGGGFYTGLSIEGQPIANAGLEDPFIAKLSATGKLVWKHGWGGDEYERLHGLAIGADDSIVAIGELGMTTINVGGADLTNATSFDDTFLVKLTP